MSFFNRLKPALTASDSAKAAQAKKGDPSALQPTPLEKHLADVNGVAPRPDGSDKFFGFENYGSTCYCNSIIQCLYYSAPFREHVLSFPSKELLEEILAQTRERQAQMGNGNGAPLSPRNTSSTPYPNPTSPARKAAPPTSPNPGGAKPEETKDSPEHRKKLALAAGPVLDMTGDNSAKYGMDESLFTSLKDIFEAIIANSSRIGVVSPHKFLEILRRENEMFRSAMHQDAHEFLNLLLNQVIDNVEILSKQHPTLGQQSHTNGAPPEKSLTTATASALAGSHVATNGLDTHWVHDLFEGVLTSETRCLTCENTSQRDEAFLDLSVDLSAHTSVTSCLRKFSQEEMLCERNKFHCDNCGGLQEAEKRMKIKRLPRVLALHLKRFKYTEDLQRLQKLFHRVMYPFHLRLFNTTDDADDADRLYELYAVVVHIGGGPYHGHYVSIIKTQDRGWLLFDDELVEPVDKSYVLNFFGGEPVPGSQDAKQLACAYVLFYQETTLEAMLREQEAEGQPSPESRVSDAETARTEGLASPVKNGLHQTQTQTVVTPVGEDMEHMESLAYAATAPPVASLARVPVEQLPNVTALSPGAQSKTKKDLKLEEKEKKAREKAELKVLDQKRKEESAKRVEMWRKQDEDLKRGVEESKQSAAEDARKRGDGGLARFRQGSMSLRLKPGLGRKARGTEQTQLDDEKVPSMPKGFGDTEVVESGEKELEGKGVPVEEKKSKNRFSLGRKKSQGL